MKQIQKDKHHDDTQNRQEVFLKRVVRLYDVMKEMGNPFGLYSCQKSQLVDVFKGKLSLPDVEPSADCIIIDGSAMVNASAPGRSKTFEEYAKDDIISKVMVYASKYRRNRHHI